MGYAALSESFEGVPFLLQSPMRLVIVCVRSPSRGGFREWISDLFRKAPFAGLRFATTRNYWPAPSLNQCPID